MVQQDRPQTTIWRMRNSCCITKAKHTHTNRISNIYCSSTTKIVARTRLNVKLLHTLPVWLSHHYAYSAFLVNQFTAQNNMNMQIFLQSVIFQSNHNRPSDIVFNRNM